MSQGTLEPAINDKYPFIAVFGRHHDWGLHGKQIQWRQTTRGLPNFIKKRKRSPLICFMWTVFRCPPNDCLWSQCLSDKDRTGLVQHGPNFFWLVILLTIIKIRKFSHLIGLIHRKRDIPVLHTCGRSWAPGMLQSVLRRKFKNFVRLKNPTNLSSNAGRLLHYSKTLVKANWQQCDWLQKSRLRLLQIHRI